MSGLAPFFWNSPSNVSNTKNAVGRLFLRWGAGPVITNYHSWGPHFGGADPPKIILLDSTPNSLPPCNVFKIVSFRIITKILKGATLWGADPPGNNFVGVYPQYPTSMPSFRFLGPSPDFWCNSVSEDLRLYIYRFLNFFFFFSICLKA